MVKLAFICEDDAGKKIIASQQFDELLSACNIERLPNIINAKGKGNLTEENIVGAVNMALENGADYIFLLTDMDTMHHPNKSCTDTAFEMQYHCLQECS